MPKKCPAEVRERAIRMALDRVNDCPSINALTTTLASKLNVGVESLRKWGIQAHIDAGEKTAPSSQ